MLECLHLPLAQWSAEPSARLDEALGYAGFYADPAQPRPYPDIPGIAVRAPALPDSREVPSELWRAAGPLSQGRRGALAYRHNADILFGSLTLPESDFPDTSDRPALRRAAEFAYREIFGALDDLGFLYLYRAWNYIPAINQETHGLERYRQFNVGRQEGFIARTRAIEGAVPAASALGSAGDALQICFLAGKAVSLSVENPRQLSAYRYPSEYGPRSPTFSRANVVRLGGEDIALISGTASIVGHATVHPGDPVAQTRESMANIAALLQEIRRKGGASFDPAGLLYKVYIRRAADFEAVREAMRACLGREASAVFLLADICRQDLLLEIEAAGRRSAARADMAA